VRLGSLEVFALSVAAFLSALLFLIAALAGVSMGTALARALVGLVLLSVLGLGAAALLRWLLRPPTRGGHIDAQV